MRLIKCNDLFQLLILNIKIVVGVYIDLPTNQLFTVFFFLVLAGRKTKWFSFSYGSKQLNISHMCRQTKNQKYYFYHLTGQCEILYISNLIFIRTYKNLSFLSKMMWIDNQISINPEKVFFSSKCIRLTFNLSYVYIDYHFLLHKMEK